MIARDRSVVLNCCTWILLKVATMQFSNRYSSRGESLLSEWTFVM